MWTLYLCKFFESYTYRCTMLVLCLPFEAIFISVDSHMVVLSRDLHIKSLFNCTRTLMSHTYYFGHDNKIYKATFILLIFVLCA